LVSCPSKKSQKSQFRQKVVVNIMLASCPSQKSQPSQFRQKGGDQHHAGILPITKITAITVQTKKMVVEKSVFSDRNPQFLVGCLLRICIAGCDVG
jgi:hypothetical protein